MTTKEARDIIAKRTPIFNNDKNFYKNWERLQLHYHDGGLPTSDFIKLQDEAAELYASEMYRNLARIGNTDWVAETGEKQDYVLTNLLDDTEEFLRHLEDFTHGKDGDTITELRHRIRNFMSKEHLSVKNLESWDEIHDRYAASEESIGLPFYGWIQKYYNPPTKK